MTVILLVFFFFLANSVSNFSKYLEGKNCRFLPFFSPESWLFQLQIFFLHLQNMSQSSAGSVLLVEALSPGPSSYPCPFVSRAESANVLRKKVTVECYRLSFPKFSCLIIAPVSSNRCFKHLSGFPSYSQ